MHSAELYFCKFVSRMNTRDTKVSQIQVSTLFLSFLSLCLYNSLYQLSLSFSPFLSRCLNIYLVSTLSLSPLSLSHCLYIYFVCLYQLYYAKMQRKRYLYQAYHPNSFINIKSCILLYISDTSDTTNATCINLPYLFNVFSF